MCTCSDCSDTRSNNARVSHPQPALTRHTRSSDATDALAEDQQRAWRAEAQREAACGRCARRPLLHRSRRTSSRHGTLLSSRGSQQVETAAEARAIMLRASPSPRQSVETRNQKKRCLRDATREPTVDERQSMIPSVTVVAIWKRESITTRKGSHKVSYARRRGGNKGPRGAAEKGASQCAPLAPRAVRTEDAERVESKCREEEAAPTARCKASGREQPVKCSPQTNRQAGTVCI